MNNQWKSLLWSWSPSHPKLNWPCTCSSNTYSSCFSSYQFQCYAMTRQETEFVSYSGKEHSLLCFEMNNGPLYPQENGCLLEFEFSSAVTETVDLCESKCPTGCLLSLMPPDLYAGFLSLWSVNHIVMSWMWVYFESRVGTALNGCQESYALLA